MAYDQPVRSGAEAPSVALGAVAAELAAVAGGLDPEVAAGAQTVAARLREGRFEVAIVGAFNRGKSTLVNALVGAEVLPAGVVPLTAVGTEVRAGTGSPQVIGEDGSCRPLSEGETLADVVTEVGNPHNRLGARRVVVPVEAPLLAGGLVLIDTPGTGSVNAHNDVTAARQLLDADGAIVVLSADTPFTQDEQALLATLQHRRSRTFYVLNKVDHLGPGELAEVRRFVSDQIAAALGRPEPVWCISASTALRAALAGKPLVSAGFDYPAFVDAVTSFSVNDLIGARDDAARHRLLELCGRLQDHLDLGDAAAVLDGTALASAVGSFRAAAATELRGWADDVVLLRRDAMALIDEVGRDMADMAVAVPASWQARVASAAEDVGRRALAGALADEVERTVRAGFDELRRSEADAVDTRWAAVAARARERAVARINALRTHASAVFDVPLVDVVVPSVSDQVPRFSYHFERIETPADQVVALGRIVLPPGMLRRRAVAKATRRLADELDKHAGRARVDLGERIQAASRQLEHVLGLQVDQTVTAVLAAAQRAEHLHRQQAADREVAAAASAAARRRLDQVLDALVDQHGASSTS
ncbi:MAG: dynamin family protein [Actinomycetota bacterium]|nr:dynamin family protein [Actinomycetota bacterium]